MKPQNSDDLIAYLYEYIWERVKDEDICITDDSFRKMDDKIQKILRKELGNPNKVLFLLKYSEEPVVADCMVTILRKLLKRESKKSNSFSRFFSHKAQKLWKFLTCCITLLLIDYQKKPPAPSKDHQALQKNHQPLRKNHQPL
ncbi:hypothetical protein D4764_01G0018840 [Takifugu flavidus]|uniref:Uncharacterized protein n=1 Tax=Takifugu flavidus TaxID=433684 RepID=A0A5C6PT21_9TELE|nr:hypothetical protein D4764_01G0018840 [Takifugu flavidus]